MPDRERLAREQAALAELGKRVAAHNELGLVLQGATELVAHTLNTEHATVLELTADEDELRLRAGVGWQERQIGHTVDASPGGYVRFVLDSETPVVVNDIESETRFAASPVLAEAGVTASVAACIPGPTGSPFGVIGAHSTTDLRFTAEDGRFIAGVANVLSSAISRHRRAIEMNDEILQTLVLAQYALREGRGDAEALVEQAITHTRAMITRLLGPESSGSWTLPGDLRRAAPPSVSRDQD